MSAEIQIPKMTIQIRLPLAVKSVTRRFNIGSKRNDAKIKAVANVPSIPAVSPKRKVMMRIRGRNTNGRKFLNELAWNNKVINAAKTLQVKLPTMIDIHGFTGCKS